MKTNHILTEFDRERKNPGESWQVLEFVTRNADPARDFGFVSHSCFPPDKLDKGIKDQIEFFSKLNLVFEWKVFEHDMPRDLRERLVNFGFNQGPPEAFMIVDLKNLPSRLKEMPKHDIRKLNTLHEFEDYEKVSISVPLSGYENWTRTQLEKYPDTLAVYAAYSGDTPVSIGRVDFESPTGVFAGLFSGKTLPEHRRKGFYTSLVITRLQEACKRNYQYAYVDALPTSEPILTNLGFTRISTSYPMIWKPKKRQS